MAQEQLPEATYDVGQTYDLTGFEIITATPGFEEDAEDKVDQNGRHKAKITYSRRETLQLELEALTAGTPSAYIAGGEIESGVFPLASTAQATAWNIRSASNGVTKGVTTVSLDLIQQGDQIEEVT